MNLCAKLQCDIEVNPLPATWSSWCWSWEDSTRCLVDSWGSTLQTYTIRCVGILLGCNFRLRHHFRDAILRSFSRHGWCHRSFQFSPRVFENVFVFFVVRISKVNSPLSSSIVELWLFFCPFLFLSILSGFTNFRPCFWSHMIWSGSRLNLCQSLTGPHISFWRRFSFNIVNFVNPFRESDKCLFESTFQWSSTCFSCNTSRSVWVDPVTSMYFSGHVELNSRFIVMTIDEVTLDRLEVGTGFSVTGWYCRLRLSPFTLKFSPEIFTPHDRFPPWTGFSEFVVSSWQFVCAICNLENEFIIFLPYQYFFCVHSSRKNFWCIQPFQVFQICYQKISFPNSHPRPS